MASEIFHTKKQSLFENNNNLTNKHEVKFRMRESKKRRFYRLINFHVMQSKSLQI